MAAYAALVSLMNLIDQIQNHPRPPISLHQKQVESLTEKIAFLEDFLEAYNTCDGDQEVDRLRSRIADAAYAAEDVIESHIVDQITQSSNFHGDNIISLRGFFEEAGGILQSPIANTTEDQFVAESTSRDGDSISSIELYQSLQIVIESMDFIGKEVMEIKDKVGSQDQLQSFITTPFVSSESPSTEKNTMVGFDNVLYEVLEMLTGQQSHRQIISISGMGGIGKTTLARNVFEKSLVKQRFDVLAWVTISQEYNIHEILLQILLCLKNQGDKESLNQKSEQELGLQLHQSLIGRRYLIIMDDMWSVEAWDKVKFFFPENNNGSRIVITTRISNMVFPLTTCSGLKMDFLDQGKSWSLLCKTVFGEEDCPPELEYTGMMIAKNCKGLPLSIVVIGGLLAKSKQTREYWETIAENLSSVVNLEDNELCLKILHTSYEELPVHLKACFLYMGIFLEDSEIRVSEVIKLWVSEGFLKPSRTKSMEEIAEEYLIDLIDRNLILVTKHGSSGNIKFCNIHDLVRDLCLREAHREQFLCVTSQHRLNIPHEGINIQRRVVIPQSTSKEECLHSLKSASVTRSVIGYFDGNLPLINLRLLRVLNNKFDKDGNSFIKERSYGLESIDELVNLRYFAINFSHPMSKDPSFVSFWNLQTLIIQGSWNNGVAPPEIWKMSLLRHVKFRSLSLPDPLNCGPDDFVLENLQTLSGIRDLKCSEEVVKRIPNVKKLKLDYKFEVESNYLLNNFDRLHKLESLDCEFDLNRCLRKLESLDCEFDFKLSRCRDIQNNLSLPGSLKKLTLCHTFLHWEDMSTKIGSLPLLQVLKLRPYSFVGSKWETVEGQFPSLKYLQILNCNHLECLMVESSHFPRLEHLVLKKLRKLKEIPQDIGEIPTLKSIWLEECNDSVIISAQRILEEQEELGNEGLQVQAWLWFNNDQSLESLASHNFKVQKSWAVQTFKVEKRGINGRRFFCLK